MVSPSTDAKVLTKFTAVLILAVALGSSGVAQDSPHGDIKIPCQSCHTTDSWKMRSDARFDHTQTGFVLDGQHKTVACANCHKDLKFTGANNRCASCHTDVHKSELGSNCLRCHTTQTWQIADMIQKHQATRFPLVGVHASVPCQDCHTGISNNQFIGTPTTCIGCHRNDFTNTTNPNHPAAGFSTNCAECHAVNALTWNNPFDHNSLTRFPLTGAHKAVPCVSCHQNVAFKSTPIDCYPCHTSQFTSTTDPNHVTGGFPTNCNTCHTTTVWRPSTFTHDNTRFPLTGAHRAVACNQCHTNNQYTTLSTNCVDCHRSDFASTTSPNHQAGGFPQNCTMCHTTISWQPASFDHNTTKFPLTGFHLTLQCQSCHVNNNYQISYSNCYQCHSADFAGTNNPNHQSSGFSTNCVQCHSTTSWDGASFDHSSTKFALTGAHASVQCQACHVNNNYTIVYSNCYQCHSTDFTGATNPNHVAGNFSQNCQTCHSTTAWQPATFDHSTTKFPLTGVHTSTPCQSCHTNGNYQLVFSNCYQCHSADFTGATNPNHVAGNFSQNCQTCHSTNAWQPATFDHSTTKFPLTGVHTTTPCQSCHTNGNYQLVFSNCYQCHSADFTGATNPNHVAGNFSQNCQTCHSTTAWQPATFDHTTTKFPLTGAHTTTPCQSCHTNGNYQLSYTGCYSCHTVDYNGTTNPNHASAAFPTTCETCHTTTNWTGATFNHAWFPMTHGNANSVCATCHTNPSNYAVFSCTNGGCHPQAQTNSNHSGVNGYVYNSANCYSCHPNGRGG